MAVDILSYKGNAAQGYGVEGTPFIGDRSEGYNQIGQTLKELQQQGFARNLAIYNQKVKDRNDVLNTANSLDIDIDVLDPDRTPLQEQYEKIKQIQLANPDLKSSPKAYQDFQSEVHKFKEMRTSAKTRATEIKKMQLEYASNTDPEYKRSLAEHIKSQIDGGILHMPDPYQKMLDWSDKIFFAPTPVSKSGEAYKRDNLYYRKSIQETPLQDFVSFYNPVNFIEGENKTLPNELLKFYGDAVSNPQFMSDQNLLTINSKLDEINLRNGLKEGDPTFLKHIAVKNEDGQWQITANPLQLTMAVDLMKNYKYSEAETPDEKAQKAALIAEQTKTQVATQGLRAAQAQSARSTAALNNIHGKLYQEQRREAALRGDLTAAKIAEEKAEGAKPVDETISTFYNLSRTGGFKAVAEIPGLGDTFTSTGLNPDSYEIADVTKLNSRTAKKILSQPKPFVKGRYDGYVEPTKVFIVKNKDGSLNNSRLVGLMPDGTYNVITPEEAPNQIIRNETGFIRNAQTVRLENLSRKVVQESQGSEQAGMDLDAIVKRNNVTSTIDPTSSTEDVTASPAPAQSFRYGVAPSSVKARKGKGGGWEVEIEPGVWKKAVGHSKKTGEYKYEN